jgi:hypothetical protein
MRELLTIYALNSRRYSTVAGNSCSTAASLTATNGDQIQMGIKKSNDGRGSAGVSKSAKSTSGISRAYVVERAKQIDQALQQ